VNRTALNKAIQALKAGQVVAFPTETVFGLGAALSRSRAIKSLFRLKKRPRNKPLQILVANLEQAQELGEFNEPALKLAKKGWPGPLTLVVPKKKSVPRLVTGGSDKVGLRVPAHRTALALIKAVGPLVASSANRANDAPALTVQEVKLKLPEVKMIVPGRVRSGRSSKVIDPSGRAKVLRA
jgi:L-threonylcarbamoyladenylate synthase